MKDFQIKRWEQDDGGLQKIPQHRGEVVFRQVVIFCCLAGERNVPQIFEIKVEEDRRLKLKDIKCTFMYSNCGFGSFA